MAALTSVGRRIAGATSRVRAFVAAMRTLLLAIAGASAAAAAAVGAWARLGPLPDGLLDQYGVSSTVIVDRFGEPLYEVRGADGRRGEWIAAAEIPAMLADATIAAEDRRFRHHVGV